MRFLTVEEEKQILALLRHWGREITAQAVEALIDTGCRPGELLVGRTKGLPIKWSEVSKSAGGTAPDVNDPATGTARAVISLMRTKTKSKGQRVLPLTDRAKAAFLASRERGESRPFGGLTTDTASEHVRQAAEHLGLDDVVLYTMRHTCASRLVQRGADLRRIMHWMGHTNISTTLRYAKLTPTDIFKLETLLR
ncbi:site-specific integrase [Phaeovulum vinaykumarii]|uniref:Phage integrase family protein n=1 Tax=Phaeovulum vinaykumarii TaxID=407234 RepID=A0A1N7L905_9RHOB|nr:site-specific integrase [Phaeovulum vinaykumarii]SIS70324.1 Phage integrase family protein [Phaeovulum vinaykumarii]SOB98975.1 phage integrase family protein [Phaeovulum vinaykumarii]